MQCLQVNASQLPPAPLAGTQKSRLTVISTFYHNAAAEAPTGFDHRWGRWLESDEQPYVRRFKVGREWQRLECGWIRECSQMQIENLEGRFTQVIPTPAEKRAALGLVVEVGLEVVGTIKAFATVRPGESGCRIEPTDLASLWVRCSTGEARCALTLIPS